MLSQAQLKAPKNKFRVVGVDTFDGTDWIEKDCATEKEAFEVAAKRVEGVDMLKMHVYDDKGNHLKDTGTF